MGYLAARMGELQRAETRASGVPLGQWATRIRLEGRPFTFKGHAYLRAIYDDTSPHVVLVKASQIGGSVYAILRALHACLSGLNVIYFFPTRTDVLEFSKSRVSPLIAGNPFLAKMVRDTDTAGLKKIGEAHLHLRGMQSSVQMKSVPADMIIFDELDEATPDAKAMAKERLAHSDYKRIIELSNPSLPDYGIDEPYRDSDQRHWMNKCPACGHWVSLVEEFPKKLGEEVKIILPRGDGSFFRACPKCTAELDIEAGEWVPTEPDNTTHGYLISQLFSSRMDPGDILRDYRKARYPERFYNLKIGIPWADTTNRLDMSTVLKHCGEHELLESSTQDCTMGVDTGRVHHVVISHQIGLKRPGVASFAEYSAYEASNRSRQRRIVHIGEHSSYDELDALMERFNVRLCVIDAMPDIHATRSFMQRHAGHVYLNFFNEHQRGADKWDGRERTVQVNRTEALDFSRRLIRDGKSVLPRRSRIVEEFARHLTCDAKQLVEDEETGAQSYRYVKTGENHYSMAFTYDCMAAAQLQKYDVPFIIF